MPKARPVFPGSTLFVTRRVHKRQLLLRPAPKLNQVIEYIFAVLAERHGIQPHALCAMSNHIHDVSTDPHGNIVEFRRDLHALLARHINAMFGDFESFWSRSQTILVDCAEPNDILDKIVYTLANPVEALLVAHGHNWPGVRRAWPAKPKIIRRPPGFFRDADDGGTWPEEVTLTFDRPPGFDEMSDESLGTLIRANLERREAGLRDEAKKAGKRFMGRKAVLRQSRYAYPSSCEKRFSLRPTVAAKSRWARVERLQRRKDWYQDYLGCFHELRAGNRDVLFPYGTYKLRSHYRIACRPPPPH